MKSIGGATALALTAIALSTHVTQARGSGQAPCRPPGTVLLAHDATVRVYARKGGAARRGPVIACLSGRMRGMTLLAAPPAGSCCFGVGDFLFAGDVVALQASRWGVDSATGELLVANVERRQVLQRIPDIWSYADAGFVGEVRVTKLLLNARGDVAWISASGRRGGSVVYSVRASAPGGSPATLAEGAGIGEESLSLSGSTLSWWQDGSERSAQMP
jgi:hypothetical protein